MNPAEKYGKWKNAPAIFNYLNTTKLLFKISTYKGTSTIVLEDGTTFRYNNNFMKDLTDIDAFALSNNVESYTGNVKVYFSHGLKDVYSLCFPSTGANLNNNNRMVINDLGAFLRQFPNLYSYNFGGYYYADNTFRPTVIGNFADIPDYLRKIKITTLDVLNTPSSVFLDLNLFPDNSLLEMFWHVGTNSIASANLKVTGDLSNLPPRINFFRIEKVHTTSVITYTPGKVWASEFDTFYLNITLPTTIINDILIDMDNSIRTAIGSKVIYLKGTRTATQESDAAILALQNKGFTITINA
ncbi:MAG: hypothetical protein E2600_15910 [Chryseobacterium sp.]|nr:hypothetical protein [Chryseobacterium sp.]